jgi:hypothetical protein
MTATLRTPRTQTPAPCEQPAPVPAAAPASPVAAPAAVPKPVPKPATAPASLPSDHLALVVWLTGAAIILSLLAKDLLTALMWWK